MDYPTISRKKLFSDIIKDPQFSNNVISKELLALLFKNRIYKIINNKYQKANLYKTK